VKNKVLSLLGLCKKAGHLIWGFDETTRALEKGNVELLLLAADLSPKSAKEMIHLADRQNINAVRLDVTMEELWYTLGKRVGILAVTQKGLADKIVALTRAPQNEEESKV